MDNKRVEVTQPALPPLDEYVELLQNIWERKWLTNNGYYHEMFEQTLSDYLGVKYVSLFCNGTVALQVGLQALNISGEVITTPFSFPATTHALWWNHCTPVFCDIDPESCNLDPSKIESLITKKTTALLPVHVYGNPCDTEAIKQVADYYGVKIFYDAAHAFGVKLNGQSILNYGDLSMLSFHATKVFNTAEGGALITDNPELKQQIDYLKNFGFSGETTVIAPGTNGKMNELQAALGLLQLKYIDMVINQSLAIDATYRSQLESVPGIYIPSIRPEVIANGSYFPIFIDKKEFGIGRDELYERLKRRQIYARRYFYPLISELAMYKDLHSAARDNLQVALEISNKVICLPIHAELGIEVASQIAYEVINMSKKTARHS